MPVKKEKRRTVEQILGYENHFGLVRRIKIGHLVRAEINENLKKIKTFNQERYLTWKLIRCFKRRIKYEIKQNDLLFKNAKEVCGKFI